MLIALLLACAPPSEPHDSGAHDRRVYEQVQEVLPTLAAAEMEKAVLAIEDPVFRATLVLEWVRHHRGRVRDADRDRVCGLLDGMERHHCVRDLMAAHLNR